MTLCVTSMTLYTLYLTACKDETLDIISSEEYLDEDEQLRTSAYGENSYSSQLEIMY